MPNGSTGVVKWFSEAKAYGFIRAENEEKDVYVHTSQVAHESRPLVPGMGVTFNLLTTPRGKTAVNVRKVQPEASSGE